MMKKTTLLLAVSASLLSMLAAPWLLGDTWMYPTGATTYYSGNKTYALTVTPPPDQKKNKKKCMAVLKRSDSNAKNQVVWQAALVNPVKPLEAMITSTGDYVVTFDTWFGVGTDPIVIYDSKGKLVCRHSLESLGLMEYVDRSKTETSKDGRVTTITTDDDYITRSVSSIWWQKNAIKFFVKDERYLIIRLGWGMLLGVELSTGRVLVDVELKALKAEIDENVRREMSLLLASDKGNEQAKGALIAGQEKYASAIPRLRELLKSKERYESFQGLPISGVRELLKSKGRYESVQGGQAKYNYYVRKASLDALTALGEKADGVITEETFP